MQDIVSTIIGRLKNADKDLTETLASGVNVHSFDSYQRLVGKRDGLMEALTIINEILTEDDNDL